MGLKMTVNGVLGCAEGMCVSSQMYACTHFRSSWEVRGIRVLHSLGPPRSACSIVYGRVDMWASQFFLYAFKSELKSGCMWSAALRLSVGVFLWGELIFSVVITHLPTASCLRRVWLLVTPALMGYQIQRTLTREGQGKKMKREIYLTIHFLWEL